MSNTYLLSPSQTSRKESATQHSPREKSVYHSESSPRRQSPKQDKVQKVFQQQETTPKQTRIQPTSQKPALRQETDKVPKKKKGPCPWACNIVPNNIPAPGPAQGVLHPKKDVFILKVAKVGANGDRRCKIELELVTPKGPEKKPLCRIDTRDTQCDPDPPPCKCICTCRKKKKT